MLRISVLNVSLASFDRLTKTGCPLEEDVKTALREVAFALLESDVSLTVAAISVKACKTGPQVRRSQIDHPGQQVVKIVHDARSNAERRRRNRGAEDRQCGLRRCPDGRPARLR